MMAAVWAFISLSAARASALWAWPGGLGNRIVLTWVLFIPFTILMTPGPLPLVASGVLLAVLMPRDPADKVAYFIGVFPAIADFFSWNVPFPGMRYLIQMTYFKVAILVILLPIVVTNLTAKRDDTKINWNLVDSFVVFFAVYVAMMTLRDASFTAMLRVVVDQFIVIVVPYLAISRALRSKENVDRALWGFFFMAVITGWIVAFSSILQWEFYNIHDTPGFTFRNGRLRVSSTMNTASVCTAVACGFVIAEYFRQQSLLPRLQVWGLQILFIFAIFGTGNRGGLLQVAIAVAAMFGLRVLGVGIRRVLLIVGLIGIFVVWPMIDWVSVDPTFAYRAELISASMQQFYDYPIFGQVGYSASHHFDHLGQSFITITGEREERFIDVVNWYLQVLLEYGLIGLLSFALPPLLTVSWLYRQSASATASDEEKRLYRCFFGIFAAFLIAIATTSGNSLMPLFFIVLLGMARAMTSHKAVA